MDYQKLAADILKLVGGESNVASVTNCMTRLRFNLKETGRADVDGLKKLKGVQGVVTKNGQFQVVIGTDVGNVCEEVKKQGHFGDASSAPVEKKVLWQAFLAV